MALVAKFFRPLIFLAVLSLLPYLIYTMIDRKTTKTTQVMILIRIWCLSIVYQCQCCVLGLSCSVSIIIALILTLYFVIFI